MPARDEQLIERILRYCAEIDATLNYFGTNETRLRSTLIDSRGQRQRWMGRGFCYPADHQASHCLQPTPHDSRGQRQLAVSAGKVMCNRSLSLFGGLGVFCGGIRKLWIPTMNHLTNPLFRCMIAP